MKQEIDTIIFDLGGVLVDWNPAYVYRPVFNNDEEKVQWFLKTVCTSDWNNEQDSGRTIEEAVAIKIKEFPQYEKWIRVFYNEWHHMFSGPIKENVALFQQLKASGNYKIYALTNWSAEKWELALKLFPFFNNFNGVVVSGQEKTRKPNPELFKILMNRYEIISKKAIFIDDNKENILAAKTLNFHGILYKNPLQLLETLHTYHIKY
ncbi:MAG: HAD family hydrolase [Flavobacteriaceae bacterium]|nr:MAG: HAD family hydrolase [Flavobacteriaceae bacterium]